MTVSATGAAETAQGDEEFALETVGLTKRFPIKGAGHGAELTALSGLNLRIRPGETLALVGESGSGKSTAARCIVQLTSATEGEVRVRGRVIEGGSAGQRRAGHRSVQLVFQDPNGSLDPQQTVRSILEEPLKRYFSLNRVQRAKRIRELLADVELTEAMLPRKGRQLSGGQRQRLGLARALAVNPAVIVLDEPTASLDVSTRGSMLRLLNRVQEQTNVAFLLISHDLSVVRSASDRVAVLYLGEVVEEGATEEVFTAPRHPYTKALIAAAPPVGYRPPRAPWRLSGEIPSPVDRPTGCPLSDRCPMARELCTSRQPVLRDVGEDHVSSCLFADELVGVA